MSNDFKGFDPPAAPESVNRILDNQRRIMEESGLPPGKIIPIDGPLLPPAEKTPQQRALKFIAESGWFVIVFPDSDMHWALAEKLAKAKPGEMVPLSANEMALLTEFTPWPKPPRSASF